MELTRITKKQLKITKYLTKCHCSEKISQIWTSTKYIDEKLKLSTGVKKNKCDSSITNNDEYKDIEDKTIWVPICEESKTKVEQMFARCILYRKKALYSKKYTLGTFKEEKREIVQLFLELLEWLQYQRKIPMDYYQNSITNEKRKSTTLNVKAFYKNKYGDKQCFGTKRFVLSMINPLISFRITGLRFMNCRKLRESNILLPDIEILTNNIKDDLHR